MNATQIETGYQPVHQEEAAVKTIAGGALVESIGALATVVLAIAGLAGVYSITLAAIATILLGASIWIEGGASLVSNKDGLSGGVTAARIAEWTQGFSGEFLAGLSGIVLGILALLQVVPMTLLPVAILVFGATFLFSTRSWFVSSAEPMFGLAGLILGLLAICGLSPLTLVFVGLLCLGVSVLFNRAAQGLQMAFLRK